MAAVLGAVVLPVMGLIAVMMSDTCGGETALICGADAQNAVAWLGILGGPGTLVAGLVTGLTVRRLRWSWPWWVVGAQVVAAMAVMAIGNTAP